MAAVANLFERLGQRQLADNAQTEQLEPEIVRKGPQPLIPPAHSGSPPSEKLLAFLINHWPKNTITLRDISAYGPNSVRDPADAINLITKLAEFGWLVPAAAWRRDQKKWQIIREPSKSTQV
jgi:hypothetical protein